MFYAVPNRFTYCIFACYPTVQLLLYQVHKPRIVTKCPTAVQQYLALSIDDIVELYLQLQINIIIGISIGIRKSHFIFLGGICLTRIEYMKFRGRKPNPLFRVEIFCGNILAQLFAYIVKTTQRHIIIRRALMFKKDQIMSRKQK